MNAYTPMKRSALFDGRRNRFEREMVENLCKCHQRSNSASEARLKVVTKLVTMNIDSMSTSHGDDKRVSTI